VCDGERPGGMVTVTITVMIWSRGGKSCSGPGTISMVVTEMEMDVQ
jgi:hypothetical protein